MHKALGKKTLELRTNSAGRGMQIPDNNTLSIGSSSHDGELAIQHTPYYPNPNGTTTGTTFGHPLPLDVSPVLKEILDGMHES